MGRGSGWEARPLAPADIVVFQMTVAPSSNSKLTACAAGARPRAATAASARGLNLPLYRFIVMTPPVGCDRILRSGGTRTITGIDDFRNHWIRRLLLHRNNHQNRDFSHRKTRRCSAS